MKTLRFILIIALLSSCSTTKKLEPFAPNKKPHSVAVSNGNDPFAKKERSGKLKKVKHRKLPFMYRVGLFINNLRNN